jgi:hypothetical protein
MPRITAVLLGAALVLSGCTGQGATAASAEEGARASADGVTVTLPPGSIHGAGELTVSTDLEMPKAWPESNGLIFPLRPVEVTLAGAELVGEATVTFAGHDVPDGHVPVVMWQSDSGDWELLPSTTAEDGSVTARTRHFSWGFLGSFDPAAFVRDHAADLGRNVLGRAGADQPTCGNEQAPREAGVEVVSDSGDVVKWCFGIEGGEQVLKVTNNKTTFVEITYPDSWAVRDGQSTSVSSEAVARAFGTALADLSSGSSTRTARVVDAGDTLTLVVPDGRGGLVVSQISTLAWALTGIAMGLEIYGGVASALKAGGIASTSTGTFGRVMDRLTGANLSGYDAALRSCGKAISDATEHEGDPGKGFATLWVGCVPGLMQADVAATGLRMFAVGAVLAVVSTAVSAVYTAAAIVTSGLRELWDTAFAPKSGGANVYRIRVNPPPAADMYPTLSNPFHVFHREQTYVEYGVTYQHGLVAVQEGDQLALTWLSEFHNACFLGTWNGQEYLGTYSDLESFPAQARPYLAEDGTVHLRVWAQGTLYSGTNDEDWSTSTLDQVRELGAEMPVGPIESVLCQPTP